MEQIDVVKAIRAYMERENIKQYEFAQVLGVPPATVNRWLNGKAKVSKAYIEILKGKGII